ncbi:MAG: site-specific integrase [Acidobacteriota bacterium]|nr:site-specific integrase [Acidobacteriota bacterium]
MAIKKFYSTKSKAGWRFDASRKKFWSYGFDIYLESGKRKRESGFATKDLATAAAARIKLGEKNKKFELVDSRKFPTCAELFQKRIDNITDRDEKVYSQRVLQHLLDLLATRDLSALRINELTTNHVDLYAEARRRENVKDTTINRELSVVRATLNQTRMLFSGLDNFTPPKVRFLKVAKTRRERIVSSIELKAILFYLFKSQTLDESELVYFSRRRAGLLFLLSAVTGARPGELIALKLSDISEDMKVLKITGKKTRFKTAKTVRYFPLIEVVRKILAEAITIKASEFIFSRNGTLTKNYYSYIKAACASCDIVYGRKVANGLIPYDLRHTATTLIMHSGADFETVSSITGQSRHSLWHYTHANENSINAAVAVLEKFAESSFDGLGLDTKENLKLLSSANSNR